MKNGRAVELYRFFVRLLPVLVVATTVTGVAGIPPCSRRWG